MRAKKIANVLLIVTILIGALSFLTGCDSDLEFCLYMNEQIHVPNEEYKLYFKEYSDAVQVDLKNDIFEINLTWNSS